MNEIIYKLSDPFPHIVVENMYTDDELFLIWEELDFLTKPHKFIENDLGTGIDEITNKSKSESKSIVLNEVYRKKEISNILNVNTKLLTNNYLQLFSQINPQCESILQQNELITKIRYYENEEKYLPHIDNYNYTAITFFHKFPKSFDGGELIFDKYSYEIECNNNLMILFPSCIEHSANTIRMNINENCSGKGRYSMMQFLRLV